MPFPYMQPTGMTPAQPAPTPQDGISQLLAMLAPQSLAGVVKPNQAPGMPDPSQSPAAANPNGSSQGGDLAKLGNLATSIGNGVTAAAGAGSDMLGTLLGFL